MEGKAVVAGVILVGFLAGLGYMAAQEVWWFFTGLVGFCHG